MDFCKVIFKMGSGFMDGGKSFDEGFALLDKDYHQTEWLSDETLAMIGNERDTYMVYWDFGTTGPTLFWDWYTGRLTHLRQVEAGPLVENLILWVLVTVLTAPGKFSIMSPLFTGWNPTVLTFNCVGAQVLANLWINRLWAEGNVYLLMMQGFTLMQWILMLMLVWNWDLYLYDFRIVRYLSELYALIFIFAFLIMSGIELDLVFVKGKLDKTDNIFDLLSALFIGYNLALHVPTFLVNVIIVLKELTLNQFAWRKDEDYQEGKIDNGVDLDVFAWFGFSEDPKTYQTWLRAWGKEFL